MKLNDSSQKEIYKGKMNISPNNSTASSDNEYDSPEAVQLREVVELLPEPLQKEVFRVCLEWLDTKEDITKKQQILLNQISNINDKDNGDIPRSATINFEIRVSSAAKEMYEKEAKELQDEVDDIKKKTQERFANVIMKTTDLNIRAQVDAWMKSFFEECMIITQVQAISKITNTITTSASIQNNQKEAY